MFLEEQSKADKVESNYYIFSHCIVSYFIQVTGVRIRRKIGKTIGLPYWGTKRGIKGAAHMGPEAFLFSDKKSKETALGNLFWVFY